MNYSRFHVCSLLIAAVLFGASISPTFGQGRSEDRDKPTLLSSNEITDSLDGSADQYFYKFSAGPGKITVTLEVKASGTNAGAMLDLFDSKSRRLLSDVLAQGVDGGEERVVNSVQISTRQEVVLRIKGLKYGDSGGTGTYKVALSGAVNIAAAPAAAAAPAPVEGAPAAAAGPAPGGNNAPAAGNGGAVAPAGSIFLTGSLNPADERILFHRVNINRPGQATFSFSVKATNAKAGAKFAMLTETNKQPFDAFGLQPGESASKSATFDKAQTLLIMVTVNKVPGNVDSGAYSIQLSGPEGFGALAPPVESNSLSDQLEPERVGYHLANVNSPGQVSISFSVKASNANAAANFAISNATGQIILPTLEVKGGESFTKPLTFDKVQTITIFVQAVKPPDNGKAPITYSIQLSGPLT